MTVKTSVEVKGTIDETKGKLRDFDVSYAVDALIHVWGRSGISGANRIVDKTTYKWGETHHLQYNVRFPFLEHDVELNIVSKVTENSYLHDFRLGAYDSLTENQANWLLVALMDMFIYQECWNMNTLIRNILIGRKVPSEQIYKKI